MDILLSEAGPRDGQQSIRQAMATDAKCCWIRAPADAGLGHVIILGHQGQMIAALKSPRGSFTTHVAFRPDGQGVVITDSTTGAVLQAAWGIPDAHARQPATAQDIAP